MIPKNKIYKGARVIESNYGRYLRDRDSIMGVVLDVCQIGSREDDYYVIVKLDQSGRHDFVFQFEFAFGVVICRPGQLDLIPEDFQLRYEINLGNCKYDSPDLKYVLSVDTLYPRIMATMSDSVHVDGKEEQTFEDYCHRYSAYNLKICDRTQLELELKHNFKLVTGKFHEISQKLYNSCRKEGKREYENWFMCGDVDQISQATVLNFSLNGKYYSGVRSFLLTESEIETQISDFANELEEKRIEEEKLKTLKGQLQAALKETIFKLKRSGYLKFVLSATLIVVLLKLCNTPYFDMIGWHDVLYYFSIWSLSFAFPVSLSSFLTRIINHIKSKRKINS